MAAHPRRLTMLRESALCAVASLFLSTAIAQSSLHPLDLGTLGIDTFAFGINASGQVVGTARVPPFTAHPFLWQNGTITDLDPRGSEGQGARGINDLGQVVGEMRAPPSFRLHAVMWQNGTVIDLGSQFGAPSDINNSSQIVGSIGAVLWQNGTVTDLNTRLPTNSGWHLQAATAINDAGQIVGYGSTANGTRAFLLDNHAITDLSTLGGNSSEATGINNRGVVVGFSKTATGGETHAFLWQHGTLTDLGTLGGDTSQARGINELGQVVGESTVISRNPSERGFLWQNGAMIDLNTLIDPLIPPNTGWVLARAYALNNAGQIVGDGGHNGRGRAFLLDLNECVDTDHNGNPDNDGDGLCDNWETEGIDFNHDGVIDLELYDVNKDGVIDASEKADLNHKDVYVEIDWMALHRPLVNALQRVIKSFADAPVSNPDGKTGIRLHLLIDEEAVAHQTVSTFGAPGSVATSDFDNTKSTHFGTASERTDLNALKLLAAKRLVFRYALFIHDLPGGMGISGLGEQPGNDFVVSLGRYAAVGGHGRGNSDQQAGTFMHELGHTLGLDHGGEDNVNCKPNYLSVMSWSRQFDGSPVIGRQLDYSRQALPTLDKNHLNEPAGIQGPAGFKTSYVPPPIPLRQRVVPTDQPIDWNLDGDVVDTGVTVDITGPCDPTNTPVLQGSEDWSRLQYSFKTSPNFADGVHSTVVNQPRELTLETALQMSSDTDGDGVTNLMDNCPTVVNPEQEDRDQNGIGDVCEAIPPCATNVTTQLSITRGGYRRNSATGHYVQQVTLKNLGAIAVLGPVAITLDGMSSNVTLVNAAGNTSCAGPRSAYLAVNVGGDEVLSSGEMATAVLEFSNPTNTGITYNARVLSGANR